MDADPSNRIIQHGYSLQLIDAHIAHFTHLQFCSNLLAIFSGQTVHNAGVEQVEFVILSLYQPLCHVFDDILSFGLHTV
jgi:hypothetical protein